VLSGLSGDRQRNRRDRRCPSETSTLLLAKQSEAVTRKAPDPPDSAHLAHVKYQSYVRGKIERDLRHINVGRVVNQYEAKRRMAKWLGGSASGPGCK